MASNMFTLQQPAPFNMRKRTRNEDDGDMAACTGFGEHRNKRLQTLPLRTWTTPLGTGSQQSIVPEPGAQHFSPWPSAPAAAQHAASLPPAHVNAQTDTDMDVDSPALLRSASSPTGTSVSNGRLPTPIQPTFAAHVRVWGAGPGPALNHLNGLANMGHEHGGNGLGLVRIDEDVDAGMVPRTMEADADWHNVQNRRLPSPISEADDHSPTAASGICVDSPDMVLDGGAFYPVWTPGLQKVDGTWPAESATPEIPPHHQQLFPGHQNTWPGGEPRHHHPAAAAAPDAASPGPSPGRKGHTRSRHTVNTWTWQPGMQRSFSIGYRADCEKCRLKVPGHFNHIIIS